MKMKVGNWTVEIYNVEDWRDEEGYIKIRGRTLEDDAEVEFYVYIDEGRVSAYEVQDALWDADWTLSDEEERDVLNFVNEVIEKLTGEVGE